MKSLTVLFTIFVNFMFAACQTYLAYDSDQGDYIGQGSIEKLTSDKGRFTASYSSASLIFLNFQGGEDWWTLGIAAPRNQTL